ncbi:hypothetical protein BCR43DRAFT_504145 [Syncephalastrum racemosum]|uniref:Uncharacterized protein n=1 Tax=Syncephalastrum racemosum TaxID=13706 RepID=A0A1X2HE12_SYNRA|nr:hypothetical protein BCR43DRAFT_504145 [Syncephalastrum racemosum]
MSAPILSQNIGSQQDSARIESILHMCTAFSNEIRQLRQDVSTLSAIIRGLAANPQQNVEAPCREHGMFANNLNPPRDFPVPKAEHTSRPGTRNAQFSWKNIRKLVDHVLGEVAAATLTQEQFDATCDNVKMGMIAAVRSEICHKNNISALTRWGNLPAHMKEQAAADLEAREAPFLPLRACIGRWGAKSMLAKHWKNVARQEDSIDVRDYTADSDDDDAPTSYFDYAAVNSHQPDNTHTTRHQGGPQAEQHSDQGISEQRSQVQVSHPAPENPVASSSKSLKSLRSFKSPGISYIARNELYRVVYRMRGLGFNFGAKNSIK